MRALNIGIVSETQMQQHYLRRVVEDSGYTAEILLLAEHWQDKTAGWQTKSDSIDAWIVDIDIAHLEDKSWADNFQQWLFDVKQPIIFSEGITGHAAEPDFIAWARQLKTKLLHLEGQISLAEVEVECATNIWVLAASAGGPEAVKRFLDAMEPDLDIGFIYAQHIDQTQNQVLSDTVARDSRYESYMPSHGDIVCNNQVAIVPVEHKIQLQANGSLVFFQDEPWRGIYKPSIDQIVANVASVYRRQSGVIFFSGMGDDGSSASRLMALQGGQVWAQAPSDCVVASMPQEVINASRATRIDTPENLAIHLKQFLQGNQHERYLSAKR